MNKKLIALAVAGALVAPAAVSAADAEVYGKARVSFGITSNGAEGSNVSDSEMTITSHSSRLGVKGSEDLGDGLTVVYQVEGEIDLDDNKDTSLASRDSFVGLAGGFGTVLLGRHDTPYKLATKKADVWSDTYGDLDKGGLNSVHNGRVDNVLAYISPDMGGFTFIGAYVTDIGIGVGTGDDLGTASPEDHQSAISLAVLGGSGPFSGSVAYQSIDTAGALAGETNDESADAIKLGLGYKISDAASANLVYEMTTLGDVEQDNIALTGSFGISDSTAIKAAFGMRGEQTNAAGDTVDDSEGTFIALGVTTKLSKTAEVYALYTSVDNDSSAGFSSAGMMAKLDDGPKAAGDEPEASAIAVGINVSFSSK